jgi:hypothetical protein
MTTYRALNDGLEAEEITWEEYCEAMAGALAKVTLEPMNDPRALAQPVTLTEEQNNANHR